MRKNKFNLNKHCLYLIGCIPLLVQLVQSDRDAGTRKKAAQALHNLVNLQPDEKIRKRESRVLNFLEHCRAYTEALTYNLECELQKSLSSEGNIFIYCIDNCPF